MTVFVDEMRQPCGRRTRCHMIADSPEELRAFAALLNVPLGWIMAEGTDYEHFEISEKTREEAIARGASAITLGDLARKMSDRRAFERCEKEKWCRREKGHYSRCAGPRVIEGEDRKR